MYCQSIFQRVLFTDYSPLQLNLTAIFLKTCCSALQSNFPPKLDRHCFFIADNEWAISAADDLGLSIIWVVIYIALSGTQGSWHSARLVRAERMPSELQSLFVSGWEAGLQFSALEKWHLRCIGSKVQLSVWYRSNSWAGSRCLKTKHSSTYVSINKHTSNCVATILKINAWQKKRFILQENIFCYHRRRMLFYGQLFG